MKRTLAGLAAATLLPAGIVAALGTPAAAAPAAPTATAPTATAASPDMLAALQRDLGLTADGARERIATDLAASRTELRLRKQLGKAFAGPPRTPRPGPCPAGPSTCGPTRSWCSPRAAPPTRAPSSGPAA